MWSDFLSSDEKNALLGVGLRFREIFYKDRQYLRDMIRPMGKKAISLLFVFICFS